jgi:hypothetical protein
VVTPEEGQRARDASGAGVTPLPPEVREPFDGANTAHVATLMRDGAPHCVPTSIGVEGDRLAHHYIGAPYPMRTDRVLFLVDAERAWAQAFG